MALAAAGFFAYQAWQDRARLWAEQREAAVEKAILEAMSGDAPAALRAIAEAEGKDAEPGQLNLLRGLVEHHRGRPKEAIVYLEQAEKQMPGSVAVKALLAAAYTDDGQWQRFDEMYTRLEELEPKSPEDHLLLGLSLAEHDPARALGTLDRAPARSQQSTVARLARALAQTSLAQMTGRAEDAERALDDLKVDYLPDNPLLLSTRVRAHLAAAHAYGPKNPRREAAMNQATRDVGRLAAYRDNSVALIGRCNCYFVQGDDDALLDEVRQARKRGVVNPYATDFEVGVLYGRKQFDEALRVLQTSESAGYEVHWLIARGIVLVAIPGRKDEAAKAFTDAVRSCKGGVLLGYVTRYLQMLGPEYRAEARQAALEIRGRSSHLIPKARDCWYHDLLAFHAGLVDAEELLKKAGDSRFNQCEAHFSIGLRKLAEGKRAEAKGCFTRSVKTGVFIYMEYIWSRAFLANIDDPDWLPWVPMKKEDNKP